MVLAASSSRLTERKPHHDFFPVDFSRFHETEACIETPRGVVARVEAELHLFHAIRSRLFDEQVQRTAPIALALVACVDHEPPDPELNRRVAKRHDEPDRNLIG